MLAERDAVSAGLAVRLGKLCDTGAGFWLRLQANRDLWIAEHELTEAVARIPTLRAAA